MLPLGKLPPALMGRLLAGIPPTDPRVRLGPGVGLDCAVIDLGTTCLVLKTDPITFATDEIGWYAVSIAANDVATTGARPRWFMASLLLPEGRTDEAMVESIFEQIHAACRQIGADLVGGHTEITYGLDRPILAGTMLGEVETAQLITPRGAQPGDVLLVTKGVPIEGTAILAREKAEMLKDRVPAEVLERARAFLHDPGVSIVREARLAADAGGVTAMHDPTEGGLAAGLWELARACGHGLRVDLRSVHIPQESADVCAALGLDPLATIASGALLLAVRSDRVASIQSAIEAGGIDCAVIGQVVEGEGVTDADGQPLPWPERDEIARVFAMET